MSSRQVSKLFLQEVRQTSRRTSPSTLRPAYSTLSFSRNYSEGSTGTPRNSAMEDSFTKREKANEDYFIKQHERELLAHLRDELKKQQKKLDNLENKLEDMKK
ncbi:hypothetical protein TBLA_0F02030 [Henningerozyma blattae CBS 6284]|uniref:ATPase inhibitor, mitochondrial n=1 Tax=Henningerozyma blattae (strain ATCC 34711 / CBS 6284 / DSM 70876 / NBRC 10599 / NRRL Y-10934 / UCD 77-7) TaxID=1071380 RepID=I2H5U3_HENB6|nr:hypothetical protein TBLA_0F02030 [Tetrapisispora blattae CBS 6284]CCH61745.1 hypothetical protein TBLA_0F02030 [Tetrapisispora blattae CBS 6284]